MKFMQEFDLPFSFCKNCKRLVPRRETIFVDDKEITASFYCELRNICMNAIELCLDEARGGNNETHKR